MSRLGLNQIRFWLTIVLYGISLAANAQDHIGTMDALSSVSAMGSYNYAIPIKTIDGCSEYSPKLSLVYDSHGGNGSLGIGWGLSGLSVISATNHSVYYDISDISGISVGNCDAYSIDGQRLLLVSGNNGREGAEYTTEEDHWNKIYVDSAFESTPKSFVVKSKDGSTSRYGSTDTGLLRYPHSSSNAAIGWLLDYQEDIDGNYIEYVYQYTNDIPNVKEIRYGGNKNSSTAPMCTISFEYEDRTDTLINSVKTQTYYNPKRLKAIACCIEGNEYRRYTLTYDNVSHYSHLTSVKVTGIDSRGYPEQTFEWDNLLLSTVTPSATNLSLGSSYFFPPENSYFMSGDVDNDGISEIIGVTPRSLNDGYSLVHVYKQSGNTFSQTGNYIASGCYEWPKSISSRFSGGELAHLGNSQSNSIVIPILRTDIDGNHLARFDLPIEGYAYQAMLEYTDKMPAYAIADFDRNGKDEIVYVEKKNIQDGIIRLVTVAFDTPNNEASDSECEVIVSNPSNSKINDCIAADMDGDGLADLLVLCDNASVVLWNNNGSFDSSSYTKLTNIKYSDTMQPCDINRDGRVDFLINDKNSTSWKQALNTGERSTSLFTISSVPTLTAAGIRRLPNGDDYDSTYYCIPCDINNDGCNEFIIGYKSGGKSKTCIVTASFNGNLSVYHTSPSVDLSYCTKPSHILLGDFDGDGISEIVNYGADILTGSAGDGREWRQYKLGEITPATGRIVSVTDGLGKTTDIAYGSLLSDYSNNLASEFPVLKFYSPISVVRTITENAGGISYSTSYSYANGAFHMQGKTFLSFGLQTSTSDSLMTVTESGINTGYYVPYISKTSVMDLGGNLQGSHDYEYSFTPGRADRSFCRNLTRENYNNVLDPGCTTIFYGNFHYGQAQSVTTGSSIQQTTTYTFRDITESGNWILCQPQTIITESISSNTASGDNDYFYGKTEYTYNSSNKVASKIYYSTDTPSQYNKVGTTLYLYNANGQVAQETFRPYSSTESLVSTYQYNTEGRITHKTAPDGLVTQYAYDVYGRLTETLDTRFNTITTYVYDGLNRLTQSILSSRNRIFNPDTTFFLYESSSDAAYAYKVTERHTYAPTTIKYYDGFGRNSASSSIHFDGTEHITEKTYANRSIISFESSPHRKGAASTIGTSYEFDNLLRPLRITDPEGHITSFVYDGNNKDVTAAGITTHYEYDEDGRLTTRTDLSGTDNYYGDVVYTYKAHGGYDRIDVMDMSGDTRSVSYTYDGYGRVCSETNTNGNVKSFGYDNYGNISSITRDGKTETFGYNKYGEITSKSVISQATAISTAGYVYDSRHLLTSIYGTNSHSSYTYNAAGQLTSVREEVADPDNSSYTYYITTAYQYDGPDRVVKATSNTDDYTPVLVETYDYRNGWKNAIWLNGKLMWKLEQETTSGKIYSSANTLRRTLHAYNNNGELTSYAAFRIPNNSQPYAFSHNYTYNSRGLISSMDGKSVAYDDYNRIADYNGQGYVYDDKGNIAVSGAQESINYNGYRIQGVTAPQTNVWGSAQQVILNNGNSQPYLIEQSNNCAVFTYDADWNRTAMSFYNGVDADDIIDTEGNVSERPSSYSYNRIYCGDRYEVYHRSTLPPVHYYYVGGTPETACAVVEVCMGRMNTSLIYRDIQGSITELVDTAGNITHYYYDPWGRPCYSPGVPYDNISTDTNKFIRGYLSQEYYSEFGLLNLNARLYNPHIGRFLSPDQLFDPEGDVFGFNPYIYGNNNPCKYVDPDGKFPWLIAAAIVGGGINIATHWNDIDNIWQGLGYFGAGACVGAMTALMPTGIGFVQGAAYGALSGTISGCALGGMNAAIQEEDIALGMINGAVEGLFGGAIYGGVTGFANEVIYNCNWWNGEPNANKFISTETRDIDFPSTYNDMSPYDKGKFGVSKAISELKVKKGTNAQTEIYFRFSATNEYGSTSVYTYRADLVLQKNRTIHIYEIKTGPYARFTENQALLMEQLKRSPVHLEAFGTNADKFQTLLGKNYNFQKMLSENNYEFHLIRYQPKNK